MQEIKCKFKEMIQRTPNVFSFRFILEQEFDFQIGQFVTVIFDEQDRNNKNSNKMISLSCCPGIDYIEITKKISESEFSKKLKSLQVGDEVLFKGPMGTLTISTLTEKNCFLVGGIGITPVFPMIEYLVNAGIDKDVLLLYSNWTEEDIAFKSELENLIKGNPRIRIINVLEKAKDDSSLVGFITKEIIAKTVEDYAERTFLVFGPPKMVEVMKDICNQLEIVKEKFKSESFIGY